MSRDGPMKFDDDEAEDGEKLDALEEAAARLEAD